MGKMPINWLGKSSELKLHCFCLFDAYSMPKYKYSVPTLIKRQVTEFFEAASNNSTLPVCIKPNHFFCHIHTTFKRYLDM